MWCLYIFHNNFWRKGYTFQSNKSVTLESLQFCIYKTKSSFLLLLANLSTTSFDVMEISLLMLRWASPVKRVWFIVDLRYVFNLLIPLNDISAVAVVTGNVQSIISSLWRFGYTPSSQISKASTALDGGFLTLAHLLCQISNSPSISTSEHYAEGVAYAHYPHMWIPPPDNT